MNTADLEKNLLRYRDPDLSSEEKAAIDHQLNQDEAARSFLAAYDTLAEEIRHQPEYQPTRDLIGDLDLPVPARKGLFHPLGALFLVLALVTLGVFVLRGPEEQPARTTEVVGSETKSKKTITPFYHTSSNDSTVMRIRATRERLRARKSTFRS
jgi:hypothetical protein